MITEKYRLKNTIKYPTSLIIGGLSKLGLEIADSLIEQGGYVIIIDIYTEENIKKLDIFPKETLISFLDFTAIPHLDEDIRRLDYVFYFNHESRNLNTKVSTQQFLTFSNYLDATLSLVSKFDSKFLLTTSIKAHQLVLLNQEVGLNYGIGNQKHAIYSDVEIQKYAESLTMEYVEKAQLDARIIRLAEIIGDGIDFSIYTVFNELILNAAKSQPLRLSKDGLETEFYVHILDAAYGIIKAQFSRNTAGEIYSLAYDNAFTHLAIAYKIQEMDSQSSLDIQFIEEKDNLPSMKLYKPAPNLSRIGWAPRVSFEKAIKQSIASAKIHLLENTPTLKNNNQKNNVVDKIKGFFAIANSSNESEEELANSGPISRLIAERKRQEEIKNLSLNIANNSIKTKRKQKARSFREKIQNFFWNTYLSLGNSFGFLKNKSPTELGFLFVSGIFLVFLYLFVLSPTIVLIRDGLIIIPEYQKSKQNFQNSNYVELGKNATVMQTYLNDAKSVIDKYEGFANIIALGNQFNQTKHLLEEYSNFCDGLKNIGYALEPFNDYLNNYKNNTQLRAGTDSFLSTTQTGIDYSTILNPLNDRAAYLELGSSKIDKSLSKLNATNYNFIPTFAAKYFVDINNEIKKSSDLSKYLSSNIYLNELLGVNSTQNYLILVLDNTRQTPAGGEIAAFAMLTLKNGSLSEVVVQSPDEVKFNFSSIDANTLQEINNRKFLYKNNNNLNINDLTNIRDYKLFSQTISKVFKDTYNRKISATISLNYSSLDNILKLLSQNTEPIEVNSVKFDGGDFLQHLKLTQVGNESIKTKHSVTAQLLANSLNNIFSNLKNNYSSVINLLTAETLNTNILISSSDLDYSKYIDSQNLDSTAINNTDFFITPSINITDFKVVSLDKYPSINSAVVVNIRKDLSMFYTMDFKYPSIGSTQEVSICLPLTIQDPSVKVNNIPVERIIINNASKEKCVVIQAISESNINLNWITPPGSNNSPYSILIGLGKLRGTNMISDFKITLDPALTLTNIDPNIPINNNSAIFTQDIAHDLILKLSINR